MTHPTYLVITPMRNERATVDKTLESMVRQTVRPLLWFVLVDGSTDGSRERVQEYAQEHSFIRVIDLPDRGFDLVGKGVAQVLNRGLQEIQSLPSDYVSKLDADLDLPPDYFERLLGFMEAHPKAGVVSGHPYVIEHGRRLLERHSDHFPSGTARLYRRAALDSIGPFVTSVGWDTVDLLRLRMHGYTTHVLHDVTLHHMRRMGTRRGYVDGMIRDGRNAYCTGYTPYFFALRALYNARYFPYIVRSACMLWGYAGAYVRRAPRAVTPEELAFHVNLQNRRLLLKRVDG
jgi:glycosyltransferase involved in cell wall biosynthesis